MLRFSYTIILIPQPNKPKALATSNTPINLLQSLTKLLEKIILKSQTYNVNSQNYPKLNLVLEQNIPLSTIFID